MTARDELVHEVLWGKQYPKGGRDEYIKLDANAAHAIAKDVLAAGYRKPRIITTAQELDALPSGSVILDSEGEPNVLHDNGWVLPGSSGGYTTWAVAQSLPATVLHEPGVR